MKNLVLSICLFLSFYNTSGQEINLRPVKGMRAWANTTGEVINSIINCKEEIVVLPNVKISNGGKNWLVGNKTYFFPYKLYDNIYKVYSYTFTKYEKSEIPNTTFAQIMQEGDYVIISIINPNKNDPKGKIYGEFYFFLMNIEDLFKNSSENISLGYKISKNYFEINFPSTPQELTNPKIGGETYAYICDDYMLQFTPQKIPSNLKSNGNIIIFKQDFYDGLFKNIGGKLISEKIINLYNYPSYTFTFSCNKAMFSNGMGLLVVTNNYAYIILYYYNNYNAKVKEDFFDSFKIKE